MPLINMEQEALENARVPRGIIGGVQENFVQIREVEGNIVCMVSSEESTGRDYRAVIEVTGINFQLKAEEEQKAILNGYRAFLKGLSFPIQILVRSQRLNLNQYLQNLEIVEDSQDESPWGVLARSHAQFVRDLAAHRTLLEHRFYLVIPAERVQASGISRFFSFLPFNRKQRVRQARETALSKAQQTLDLRSEVVTQQMSALGLTCRRLIDEELADLYYSCITPDRARTFPLEGRLQLVGKTTRVATRNHASSVSTLSGQLDNSVGSAGIARKAFGRIFRRGRSGEALAPPDLPHLADVLAPASVEVTRDHVVIEDEYACAIAVTSFPREVSAGWLSPLIMHDEVIEIVFHIHPQDNTTMLRRLLRRKNQFRAAKYVNQRRGRVEDPEMNVAEEDVDSLITLLASGEERVFDIGMYLIVRAPDVHALNERRDRIKAMLYNLFLVAHSTTFEHANALRSFLPGGRDALLRTFSLDSASLATAFPFISNSLFMPDGVLIGTTPQGEPVVIDEWDDQLDNPHEFAGAITGAGKSYFYKIRIMRELLQHRKHGLQVIVIDPDGEYKRIASALGGDYVRLAPGSEQHLNPFDLLPLGTDMQIYVADKSRGDRFADKVNALHAFFDIMLSNHTSSGTSSLQSKEKGLLDRAIIETYFNAGITADPNTHSRKVPLLRDLYEVLKSGVCGKDEEGLTDRLYRYVFGSLSGPFNAHTNIHINSHLVIFDVLGMTGRELRALGIWQITDFVWTQVLSSLRPRKLYIDEAWSLIQYPEGGRFLADLARRARKRYLALCTITQNPELFAKDEWGAVVASNAATKVLKQQDRTSVDAVSARFQLTTGERERLLNLSKPEALLLAGGKRVLIRIEASQVEHMLATTHPPETANSDQGKVWQPRRIPAESLTSETGTASIPLAPLSVGESDRRSSINGHSEEHSEGERP